MTRREERLAFELVKSATPLVLPGQPKIHPIDFQVPLKAAQADPRIGKIDVVGVSDPLVIVELKIARKDGSGDTPLLAVLELLSYAACVEANYSKLAGECGQWNLAPVGDRPNLMVLADSDYWRYWDYTPHAKEWRPALARFIDQVREEIGLTVRLAGLPEGWKDGTPSEVRLFDPLDLQGEK